MKRHIQFLSLLLALLLVLLPLFSCGEKGGEDEPKPNEPQENDPEGGKTGGTELALLTGDGTVPDIVLPREVFEEDALYSIANIIAKGLAKYAMGEQKDFCYDNAVYDPDKIEVVLGTVNYTESKKVFGTLAYGDWVVVAEGNKLVIASYSNEGYTKAEVELIAYLRKNAKDGKLTLPADFILTGTTNAKVNELPIFTGHAAQAVYSVGDKDLCSNVRFDSVDAQTNDTYRGLLEKEGYTLFAEHSIGQNVFRTFTDGTHTVTTMYTPADKQFVIAIENTADSALPDKSQTYTAGVCDVLYTQVGLEFDEDPEIFDDYINGLCHIIRLEDGSFIVADGGMDRPQNAKLLYDVLKKQAPDPDHIVIAAWLISHDHGDHTGVLNQWTTAKYPDVKIERLIACNPTPGSASENGLLVNFSAKAKALGAKFTLGHAGQVFAIRNAEIEIVYSLDLYLPEDLSFFNNSTMIWDVKVAGVKCFMMGDMGPIESGLMHRIFTAPDLKSDIVQTAHHTFISTDFNMYAKIGAKYVLADTGLPVVGNGTDYFWKGNTATKQDYIEKIWIAEDDVNVLTLKNGAVVSDVTYDTHELYFAS